VGHDFTSTVKTFLIIELGLAIASEDWHSFYNDA